MDQIKYEMLQWSVEGLMIHLELSEVGEAWFKAEMRNVDGGKDGDRKKGGKGGKGDKDDDDWDEDDWDKDWDNEEESLRASAFNLMGRFVQVVAM